MEYMLLTYAEEAAAAARSAEKPSTCTPST